MPIGNVSASSSSPLSLSRITSRPLLPATSTFGSGEKLGKLARKLGEPHKSVTSEVHWGGPRVVCLTNKACSPTYDSYHLLYDSDLKLSMI